MNKPETVLTTEDIEAAQSAAYKQLLADGHNGGMCGAWWDLRHARAIESAVLAKLAQQNAAEVAEPVATVRGWRRNSDGQYTESIPTIRAWEALGDAYEPLYTRPPTDTALLEEAAIELENYCGVTYPLCQQLRAAIKAHKGEE
jgi:hypothetical protein